MAQAQRLFLEHIDGARTIVVTTHLNPDGDALGSEVGLVRFLLQRDKQVRVVNHDPTPDNLRFIADPALSVEHYDPDLHDAVIDGADLIVLLDNSAPDRMGRMERVMLANAARTLCIDHHPVRDAPWGSNIVDVQSCATAVIVYDLVTACGWTPDRVAAEGIFVGLATDTGFFRFNSTNARAHEVAADLLGLGVSPARVYGEVYERNSEAYARLLGQALDSLRFDGAGSVASVRLPLATIAAVHAEEVDTSEITTVLLSLEKVRVVALFRELSGGRVKVSLRSKGQLDVHRLAGEFGGGGHRNASGIVMAGTLDEVNRLILDRAVALAATAPS